MKKYIFTILILIGGYLTVKANCVSSIMIQHDGAGGITNVIANQHPHPGLDRFWCLSGRLNANSDSNASWFQQYSALLWWFNGNWQDAYVVGCCSDFDPSAVQSDTMIAVLEQNRNPSTVNHTGEYIIEVAEKKAFGFFFTRSYSRPFTPIPTFHIASYSSSGPGGVTTVNIDGWGDIAGPAHYWIIRKDNTEGEDLPLNPICAPNKNSPCPDPIYGYRITAIAAASPPTTGVAADWNLTVNNGIITPRVPSFPFTIQIQNPATCTASNRYIFIATQLLFAENEQSYYVSQNSIAIDWCSQNPAEAGVAMQCQKSTGTSITCTYTNGGSCTTDNTIYYGPLSSVSSYGYSGSVCNLGTSGTATFDPGPGNWFWVIVSNNGTKEGSYGKNSNGSERPEAVGIGSCDYPQDLNNTCS